MPLYVEKSVYKLFIKYKQDWLYQGEALNVSTAF